jgi:membrane fusion protein, multidrug efflux system
MNESLEQPKIPIEQEASLPPKDPPKTLTPLPPKSEINQKNPKRSKMLIWFTIAVLVAGLIWFCYWFFYLQYYQFTDDAFSNGNLTNINSPISGTIIAFYAQDTDLVKEGELLIVLDKTEYQVAYEKELNSLASVILQVRQLYDNVTTNQALVENKKTLLSKAQYDYENRSNLVNTKAISNEEFIHSKDSLLVAQLDLKQTESQLKTSLDAVGNTTIENHPIIEQQKSNVRLAFYNLQHCHIYAPTTGYVAKRAVGVGQWITPTTNLMAIIPTVGVWVDANFKETQLTYMRVGQPVSIGFDLYGSGVQFNGKVVGISSGTGSIFSIIPPQNATGNWIKIVQRLPVRISLDPQQTEKFPIRMGISAEVNVDITNQDLPRLVNVLSTHPIVETNVFEIDFEPVNQMINKIIKENLNQKGS